MIFAAPIAFEEAVRNRAARQLLPTTLTTRELQQLPAELRRRAVFSATVTKADHLQRLNDLVAKISGGLTESGEVAGAPGARRSRMISIPEAKAQLAEYLRSTGYMAEPGKAGSLQDLMSDARLQVQVETPVLDTLGFARFRASQDPASLEQFPAWELVRTRFARVPRDWPGRWTEARAQLADPRGSTEASSGRLVALKNHPIWEVLGSLFPDSLGNPWPPFAFNSGMNWLPVEREDAIALGLLEPDQSVEPAEGPGLNENLETSAARFDAALREALAANPKLKLEGGVLTLAD